MDDRVIYVQTSDGDSFGDRLLRCSAIYPILEHYQYTYLHPFHVRDGLVLEQQVRNADEVGPRLEKII